MFPPMIAFEPNSLAGRIEKRLKQLNLKPASASKKATGKEDAIRKIFAAAKDGVTRNPRSDTLQSLARVLGTSADWLTSGEGLEDINAVDAVSGPVPLSTQRVRYRGTVRAGGFFPVDEYFEQDISDEIVPAAVVLNPAFPQLPQFAWLVRGDSMDEAGISDGMWLVAAPYLDYVDRVGELFNGQPVVVERTRHGGSEIERTVKEVQFTRGGMRLIPRSTNPAHKELFVPLDAEADNDVEEVTILAVVLSAVRDYSKPSVS